MTQVVARATYTNVLSRLGTTLPERANYDKRSQFKALDGVTIVRAAQKLYYVRVELARQNAAAMLVCKHCRACEARALECNYSHMISCVRARAHAAVVEEPLARVLKWRRFAAVYGSSRVF